MKIGLVDCDSHNFPNLPLMKLSAYHKKAGDCVSFARMEESYDRLYVSKIFTESPEPVLPVCGQVIRGGRTFAARKVSSGLFRVPHCLIAQPENHLY